MKHVYVGRQELKTATDPWARPIGGIKCLDKTTPRAHLLLKMPFEFLLEIVRWCNVASDLPNQRTTAKSSVIDTC